MEDAEESCTILSHITETEKVKEIVNLSDINSHISHNIPINFISTHKILDCNFLLILPRIFPAKNVNVDKHTRLQLDSADLFYFLAGRILQAQLR